MLVRRVGQRGQDGSLGPSCEGLSEVRAQLAELLRLVGARCVAVCDVIGEPGEGVGRVDGAAPPGGQGDEGEVEVARLPLRDRLAVVVGGCGGHAALLSASRRAVDAMSHSLRPGVTMGRSVSTS